MGLGLHDGGLGVARFLVEQGAKVTVTDLRSAEVLAPTLEKLKGLPIEYVLGQHREEDFRQTELVVRNPAVPRESPYLEIARQAGASIEMEMTLFFKLCPSKLVLGITGTRGKTTTTILVGEMLKNWRKDTVVAGNLRVSALEKLSQIGPDTPVVLELSSWQLEGLGEQKISPRYAAVTNMSPDHLNRYRDMEDYADAKRNIYRWQDENGVTVLNWDDAIVKEFCEDVPGKAILFTTSYDMPDRTFTGKGVPTTKITAMPENYFMLISVTEAGELNDGHMDVDLTPFSARLKVPGRHNRANAMAALGLAWAVGCSHEAIVKGMQNFKGVPDRLELVRKLGRVRYFNDTTATSPAGTVAALQAFEEDKGKIVLIAGGADKKLDFAPMVAAIEQTATAKKLRKLILLAGSATTRLVEALQSAEVVDPVYAGEAPYTALEPAVQAAKAATKPGDIVLLSPGCASFGMFLHEFDRGEQFRQIVNGL